jgi:4-amino-4-deoxy-L-arabinose transferase-like glycosyltransferase
MPAPVPSMVIRRAGLMSARQTQTAAPARPGIPPGRGLRPRFDDARDPRRRLHQPAAPRRAAGAQQRASRRVVAWLEAHALSLTLVAGLLIVVGVVLGTGIGRYPGFSDDEGTYVAQAWAARTHGALSHYTYWYDHPPLGWLALAAATTILGPLAHSGSAVADARGMMLIPALTSAALVFVLARRLGLRRPFAAAAVLLFALSPLAVSYLRMVFLDNFATPWILAAFVLAASPNRRLWAYAASGLCLAAAILCKETSVIVLPGLILALMQGSDRRTRPFCITAFATSLGLVTMAYPLFALLKGELLPGPGHVSLSQALAFQVAGRASTGSALQSGSLSHHLVASWLTADPWLLGLGLVTLPVGLWVRRLRPPAVALLALVLMAVRPGYLPQPYVIALLPLCAVVTMGALDAGWERIGTDRVRRLGFAIAAGLGVALFIAPPWIAADGYAMSSDATRPVIQAQRWMQGHLNHHARVLVDDTFYVDLVNAGFAPRFGVVWFYKLDYTTNLDPMVLRHLPQGWREFDYVVSSSVIRSALADSPAGSLAQVRQALAHSTVIARFGSGANRVEVRRIVGTGTGSGLIPPQAPVAAAPAVRSPRRAAVAPAVLPVAAPAGFLPPAIAPSPHASAAPEQRVRVHARSHRSQIRHRRGRFSGVRHRGVRHRSAQR